VTCTNPSWLAYRRRRDSGGGSAVTSFQAAVDTILRSSPCVAPRLPPARDAVRLMDDVARWAAPSRARRDDSGLFHTCRAGLDDVAARARPDRLGRLVGEPILIMSNSKIAEVPLPILSAALPTSLLPTARNVILARLSSAADLNSR